MSFKSIDRAAYRILDPYGFFGDKDGEDHLYREGEEIWFDGIPNENMEPLNELARKRLTAYLETLDDYAKRKAEKLSVPYVGRPRTLDGAIALATAQERERLSIMGARNKVGTGSYVEDEPVPETGVGVKRGRGRPAGSKNKVKTLAQEAASIA